MAEFTILNCTGSDAARWQSLFNQLPAEYQDLLFTPAYARIQESIGQGTCHAAAYIWQDYFVFQPFVRKGSELTCFFGGAGPISNLMGKADYRLWLWMEKEFEKWRAAHGITSEYVRFHPLFAKAQRRMLRESTVNIEFLREAVMVNINRTDEELLKSFSRNRRRGIKDSIKNGGTVRASHNPYEFDALYLENMNRLGAAENWKLPKEVWKNYRISLGDNVSFLAARGPIDSPDNRAMLMVLHGYGKAYSHYLAGTAWNDLLYYESMKHCRDLGCKSYFLGGGTTSDPNDPLLAYKSGFSTLRVPVSFYKRSFGALNVDSIKKGPTALDIRA